MKRYEKYKEIDLPWLKEVPEHWGIEPLKSIFYERKEINKMLMITNVLSVMKGIGVIPYEEKGNVGNKASEDICDYKIVKKNDIVLNSMNVIIGSVGKSEYEGVLSKVYYVLNNKDNELNNTDYFSYIFKTEKFYTHLKIYGRGILKHRLKIPMNLLNLTLLPIPPLQEQIQIANFLDWKISEIDKLIELEKNKIEKMDELYKKSLNDIFNKINGEKKRLRYIFSFGKGLGITKENLGEHGYRCINYGEIHGKLKFSFSSQDKSLKGLYNIEGITLTEFAKLSRGDFIFADTSEDLIGSGDFTFLEYLDSIVYAGYHTVVCKPKIKFNSIFLAYQLESDLWRTQIRKAVNGIKVYSITQQLLKQTYVVFPDLETQESIVTKLDVMKEKLINIRMCVENQITYLQELKQTLISDVVTGKFDVRDIEIPEMYRKKGD